MNFEIAPKETVVRLNWHDAKFYCFSLNINNKTGWRLPTKDELNQICESGNDYNAAWYWSSTEWEADSDHVWLQYCDTTSMGHHRQYYFHKNAGRYHTRAIRDLT